MARHLGVVAVDNRQQGAVVCHSRRRGRWRQGAANPVKPNPYGAYFKGGLARELTPALIDATVDYLEAAPLPISVNRSRMCTPIESRARTGTTTRAWPRSRNATTRPISSA